ncbi:MAG: aspartate aminotransferase family protein [Dehalococcoidales bacterium]
MSNWQEMNSKYLFNNYTRWPILPIKGKGSYLWDENGKKYLDLMGGWAVCSLGHSHPVMIKALTKQAKLLTQAGPYVCTLPQLQLAEILVKNSCLNRVFFSNSGAEADEGAVKLARRYGKLKLNGAFEVITALNSFHGRTLAMTAATGQPHYQEMYQPLPVGFKNVPYNDIEVIKSATTRDTCAVMLEPVQGEGGVNIPEEGYLKAVRQWCDEKGILLILDEVQTGVGRLGTLFGYQQYGIEPDIMTLAKGMGGGIPIGAFLAKESCAVFQPGDHGSTFGGNALMCATAFAVMEYIINNDIADNAKKVGQYLLEGLKKLKGKYPFIIDVRGRGLLAAIEFNKEIALSIRDTCIAEGMLVNNVKPNAIRVMPALTISNKEIDEALAIFDKVFAGVKV